MADKRFERLIETLKVIRARCQSGRTDDRYVTNIMENRICDGLEYLERHELIEESKYTEVVIELNLAKAEIEELEESALPKE